MPLRSADRLSAGKDLPSLTGLRFIAALWVLGFHTLPRTGLPRPVAAFWNAGWAGVSLFFVLSGFILMHVYGGAAAAPQPFRTRDFLVARLARVYPAYLAALLFAVPEFARSLHLNPGAPSGATLAGVCLSAVTMTQAWIPGWGCWWNCPGWSLSVEAFFYLTFPLLAPVIGRLRRPTTATLGLGVWLLALAVVISLSRSDGPERVFRFGLTAWTPLLRLPEFIVGMCAAHALRRPDGMPRVSMWTGGMAAGVIFAASMLPASPWRGGLLWPGLTLPFAIVIGALSSPRSRSPLAWPWLQRLGNASYSLYLFHAVGHGYLLAVINRTIGRGHDAAWLTFAVYLVLALWSSVLMHDLVEVPARLAIRDWTRRKGPSAS